jgi:lysozyme
MKISENGINLIKFFEGFCPKPYKCTSGVPTIGYGATFYLDGTKVKMDDPGINKVDATVLLKNMVKLFEDQVNSFLDADLNQNQYDALISLSYNIGWNGLRKSKLMTALNANPNDEAIKTHWMKWVNSAGRKSNGLVKRRNLELELYFKASNSKKTLAEMAKEIMNINKFDDEIYI